MCLIIASPSGKIIPKDILDDASTSNPHGGGVAWLDPERNKVRFKKGLELEEVMEILDGPAKGHSHVVHFRIATHGGVSAELTHPFPINAGATLELEGEADAVLFQNGTWGNWKESLIQAIQRGGLKTPKAPWSDTRAMALVCHVSGYEVISLLDSNSRWLTLDATLKHDHMGVWGSWEDWQGLKFSHSVSGMHTRVNDRRSDFPLAALPPATGGAASRTQMATTDGSRIGVGVNKNQRQYKPRGTTEAVWSKFTREGLENPIALGE